MSEDYFVPHYDILLRCAAIEKEAFTANSITSDIYPYWRLAQENFPYCVNKISSGRYSFDTESVLDEAVTVEILMLVGQISEGYRGNESEVERRFYQYLHILQQAFLCQWREAGKSGGAWLASAAYPKEPTYLQEQGISLVSHSGLSELRQTNVDQGQLGTRIILSVPTMVQIGGR